MSARLAKKLTQAQLAQVRALAVLHEPAPPLMQLCSVRTLAVRCTCMLAHLAG